MTTVEWGTIREATTGVLSRCLKQLKCDTLQLPEKSLQDKCPTPGLKDTDAHQCKENCRVDTPPPPRTRGGESGFGSLPQWHEV